MKILERNMVVKKIISILLVLAIILPYFPLSVLAANDGDTTGDKVTFVAKWNDGNNVEEGTTDDTFKLDYSITLNKVPTGFQDVKLILETDGNYFDKVTIEGTTGANIESQGTAGGYAEIFFGDVVGAEIGGQASICFRNTDVYAERKVTARVTGTYIDPETSETRRIEDEVPAKELSAKITPATQVTPYSADLVWQHYKNSRGAEVQKSPSLNANREYLYSEHGANIGFYTNDITASYPIELSSGEKTQELKLTVTINRCDAEGNSKHGGNYTIDWGGLDSADVLGTPTSVTNADGSVTYTFNRKGANTGNYNSETAFGIGGEYTVKVTYITDNTHPVEDVNPEYITYVNFDAKLETTGYRLEKKYGAAETAEKINESKSLSYSDDVILHSYTPGSNAWINVNDNEAKIGNSSYSRSDIDSIVLDNLKTDGTAEIKADMSITHIAGDPSTENGTITVNAPVLTYKADDGELKRITLTANQMKLNKVEKSNSNNITTALYNGESTVPFDTSYTASSDINSFSLQLTDFLQNTRSCNYYLTYTLVESELGLTDTELDNIQQISVAYSTSGSPFISGAGSFTINRKTEAQVNNYSYMELDVGDDFDSTSDALNVAEDRVISLNMYKNSTYIYNTSVSQNNVVNVNPIFYVTLPKQFSYEITDIVSNDDNIEIDWDNYDEGKTKSGDFYLAIPCIGTYDSRESAHKASIQIELTRKLKDSTIGNYAVNAYMITDNANYYNTASNINEFAKGDEIPSRIFLATSRFNIVGTREINAKTKISREDGEKEYKPNPANDIREDAEIEQPVIFGSNEKVRYQSEVTSVNEAINNVKILARLPIEDNTYIYDTSTKILADDYKLPSDYMYKNRVNGYVEDGVVNEVSLKELNIIGVYRKDISQNKALVSNYTIYYTNDANANIDSENFIEYQPGVSDLSQAKNIMVVLGENESIHSGQSFVLEYEMTMPDQAGMVGAESAIRYTKESDGAVNNLYSPAAYVINGDTNATIQLKKTFENYPEGVVPEGLSNLAGIVFKLQYYDEAAKERKFLKDGDGQDIVATTNADGIATFDNIPSGTYYPYEVTEFEDYSGIVAKGINVDYAETKQVEVENLLKRGDIIINKEWQGTDVIPGNATFTVTRVNQGDENLELYRKVVSTNNGDKAVAENLPYGTYEIEEINQSNGWTPETVKKTVVLDSEETSETFTNIPGKGILQIVKTVPEGETVDGLTFRIKGRGSMDNPELIPFDINTDMTIKIGESYPENVTVEKSLGDAMATITISDLYLGYYDVEEIDIPVIEGTDITKYVKVSKNAEIKTHDLVNPVVINLRNEYRTGTLKIVKTAEPGVELDQFKVKVSCENTLYNTTYEKIYNIPANGQLIVTGLYLGDYTVTEVESDYFNAKYGASKSNEPQTATVEYNKVSTVNIYNENVDGYVKILKTLEGKDAESTKGIKFRLHGKDTTGADVNEIIEITEVEEIGGVKYGVGRSNAIQAGGEYELVELQETVPNYFIEMDPMKVDIKKQHTEDNPLVLEIENKRGKGNLEITTKTIPEGGELSPISYGVTEIELGEDNEYTKIGEMKVLPAISGYAEMIGIDAGMYLVELLEVPYGYSKDVPQLVEVPIDETGYAEFEIEKSEIGDNTKVVIEKELVTKSGSIASLEDLKAAKLTTKDGEGQDVYTESFEALIRNANNGKQYYVFFDNENAGVIQGLPSGRYEIEEIFKPKYETRSYMLKDGEEYTAIEAESGKYYFEIPEVVGDDTVVVTLKIQNTLNTDFGFGGQSSKDNLSTTIMEEVNKATKTIMYITDENGNVLPGVGVKLYDEDGHEVEISYDNNTYVSGDSKKVIIRGLPVGTYVAKTMFVPEGYIKPEDKIINVYEGATVVTRIEVWEDKPTGNLKLSTTFTGEDGKIYAPRSKYKILDPETGRVLTFEKTATGDYVRSKLPTATDTISLRAGSVDVTGIEVGTYQLGLVDLTEKYGVINNEPEELTVVENTSIEKEISVKERLRFKKLDTTLNTTYALNEDGSIYVVAETYDSSRYSLLLSNGPIRLDSLYPELLGVKAKDFSVDDNYWNFVIVDNNGKLWVKTSSMQEFKCVSDMAEYPLYGVKIEKCFTNDQNVAIIDENGKIWYWGRWGTYIASYTDAWAENSDSILNYETPVCLSDNTILENVHIDSVDFANYGDYIYAIDDEGNAYAWGNDYDSAIPEGMGQKPVCITKLEGCNLNGRKIKQIVGEYGDVVMFVDTEGLLWGCKSGERNIVCWTTTEGKPLYGVKVQCVSTNRYAYNAIDTDGKLWGWTNYSSDRNYIGISDTSVDSSIPVCISDRDENELSNVKLKELAAGSDSPGAVIDENGEVWLWGRDDRSTYAFGYQGIYGNPPKKLNFAQESYFDLFEVRNIRFGESSAVIMDKAGKLWSVGQSELDSSDNNSTSLYKYNSSELGTNLEGITVKDYSHSNRNTFVLDTDGRLWTMGMINEPYVYKSYYGSTGYIEMTPICLSDKEDSGISHKNIKYVNSTSSPNLTACVIDEDGNLYTTGDEYSYGAGYNLGTEKYKFQCLNDKYSYLSDVKFEKVSFCSNYCTAAIDTDGNVWLWGRKSDCVNTITNDLEYTVSGTQCYAPTKVTFPAGVKIVDVVIDFAKGAAIDEDGNVYVWNSDNPIPTKLTQANNSLGGRKIIKIGYGYKGYVYAVDANGNVLVIDISNSSIVESITDTYDIVARDIYCGSNAVIIRDIEDEFWLRGSFMGISADEEPLKLTGKSENVLYGKEIIDLEYGKVITREGDNTRITKLDGKNIGDSELCRDTGLYGYYIDSNGRAIQEDYGTKYVLSDKKFTKCENMFLLGEDKKMYHINSSTHNVTEVSGLENIDNFWIYYISSSEHLIYAQDSNGKLWIKYFNKQYPTSSNANNYRHLYGMENIDSLYEANEITAYNGAEIKDLVVCTANGESYQSTEIPYMVYCLDVNNDLWAWGNGYIGNADQGSATPVKILENAESLPYVPNIRISGIEKPFLCRDTNKTLWIWGKTFNNVVYKTPTKVMDNVEQYDYSYPCAVVIDTNNNIWTWGRNSNGELGTGDTTAHYNPTNISEKAGIGQIKSYLYFDGIPGTIYAIDFNNNLWQWGRGKKSPKLVRENLENDVLEFVDRYLVINNCEVYSVSSSSISKEFEFNNIAKFAGNYRLTKDGKLYYVSYDGMEQCILNDKPLLENKFNKKFYLLKDAKYND